MSEKFISSMHIQKLGHKILEIRERALSNIISKLDHGFVYDNDLARSKEILDKLLEWFLHEPCTKQPQVFALIKRILKSQSGKALIVHSGTATIKEELKKIKSYISPQFYKDLDEITELLDDYQVNNLVPPLETDIPLSYRTGQSISNREIVGSTATTIEGFVQKSGSATQKAGFFEKTSTRRSECFSPRDNIIVNPLKWQSLIEADRHVLQSIETSIRRPPEPAALLHSADFFSNVLLQDFSAEIFLQRPFIITSFIDLVTKCPSTRIVNAILNSLGKFTRALQVRVNHFNDPAMYNSKEILKSRSNSRCSTPDSSSRKTASGQSDDENTDFVRENTLKSMQITFPYYCHICFKAIFKYLCYKPDPGQTRRKTNRKGVNLALQLMEDLVNLLTLVLNQKIWEETSNPTWNEVQKQLNEILIGYGVVLEHFRMEASCNDSNLNNRVFQLCILQNCANMLRKLIPIEQTGFLLPRNLKNALTNCLVDVTLAKLYPDLHKTLLDYVESFSAGVETESLRKYHETNKICESMISAVEFMKNWQIFDVEDGVEIIKKALKCLEFHKDLGFVKGVIDLAAEKGSRVKNNESLLNDLEGVVLKLLAHNIEEIQEETYKLCQKLVVKSVGPLLNCIPGENIGFLIRPNVFIEIACHGLTHENVRIQNYADDILIHLLKCKILVSDKIWNEIVQSLIISQPILLCHLDKTTALGKTLLETFDPDTAKTLHIPKIAVLKANIHTLFSEDSSLREEAYSRLVWLLASQKNARDMLPRLNNLHDRALPHLCHSQRIIDVNRNRNVQHFYQPSSLQQVLELLMGKNVEPVIRRSALTQISVMMEDPLLHSTFIDRNGVDLILEIMNKALIEGNFEDYPDNVIPAIAILKNICFFHVGVRQQLAENVELLYNVLRSSFLFFTEEKLKQDAVCLMFLLVFNGFIIGTPSKGDVSVPYLVKQKLRVPFNCQIHWEISPYYEEKLTDLIKTDRWCTSSVQIQWNCELFGGFNKLLNWNQVDYTDKYVVEGLKMNNYDLECLKASSIEFCTKKYLIDIQNGVSHEGVIDSINKLSTYLHLYKTGNVSNNNLLLKQWENTFSRFLKSLPSGEEDAQLLSSVLNILKQLIPLNKNSDELLWLFELLKNPANILTDLITLESDTTEELKTLSRDILELITLCVVNEQHFLDFSIGHIPSQEIKSNWFNIIEMIANNLKFNDSTHFYNLAYLDSLLSCLVHLTASLSWSKSKPGIYPKKILSQLVASLCELVVVFHCGKGPTAAISVMGLSITRHVVLVLNHLIAEMHYTKLRNWEDCFLDFDEEDWLKSFMILWSSRDVVLRAGALQLFAGLSRSARLAINIVNELNNENGGVWNLALNLLIDIDEASIVRENAAMLLAHLTGHTVDNPNEPAKILTSLIPKNMKKGKDDVTALFDVFDDLQFYKNIINTLNCLYTNQMIDFDAKSVGFLQNIDDLSDGSTSASCYQSITTPALVKSVVNLFLNLHRFNSDRLCFKMQDSGLIKLIFRCICNPNMNIKDTRKLSLYCEILEMNISICVLLSEVVKNNIVCLGTVLHTKDCINNVISLLNKKIYHTHLPQLVYLRNLLWSEIFNLLSNLINCHSNEKTTKDALIIISEAINENGQQNFTEVLCESLTCLNFDELQNAALFLLSSLLKLETNQFQFNFEESGEEICKILLNLYDLSNLRVSKQISKKKSLILIGLSTILAVSNQAKRFAFDCGLINLIIKQLKDFHTKLGVENVDSLRRIADKKRLTPILKEMFDLIGLITNFLVGNCQIKQEFAKLGLCDLIHKLWIWFLAQKSNIIDVLEMLATFTNNSPLGCQSLTVTSAIAGSGPRKTPTKQSLLHVIINLIEKEMEIMSKTHNLNVLEMCFVILTNCCVQLECRILFCKSTLLQNSIGRLHPAMTKKQKPWESVELIWLDFLQQFSLYAEGQSAIAKINEVFELVLILCLNGKSQVRLVAMMVLRNIAFYAPNRSRLLTSDDFLNVLQTKLENGSGEEKSCCILILWTLSANNQRAKIVFKTAQLDDRLEQLLKHYELREEIVNNIEIERTKYVLGMIRDDDKLK